MIFRLTQKMAKKIHAGPLSARPVDDNPFADWCANLFTVRRAQYIILTNTRSLYSMVMYGRGIADDNGFIKSSIRYICDVMTDDGFEAFFERHIVPRTGLIRFCKTPDRRVLGSMNDLVAIAKFCILERDVSPYEVSFELNETPMSFLGMDSPKEAFAALEKR